MKCNVCNRRMNTGDDFFICPGCGNVTEFVPIAEVIEEMEGDMKPAEKFKELVDDIDEEEFNDLPELKDYLGDVLVDEKPAKKSKKKGKKK